jgi:hypothetical protein
MTQANVQLLVFDRAGQKTLAASPPVMDQIATYARDARACGLSDAELRDDIARFWPNARRRVDVTTAPGGDVWVSMTPALTNGSPQANPRRRTSRPRRSCHVAERTAL